MSTLKNKYNNNTDMLSHCIFFGTFRQTGIIITKGYHKRRNDNWELWVFQIFLFLVDQQANTHTHTHARAQTHTHTHTHIYIYVCVYIYTYYIIILAQNPRSDVYIYIRTNIDNDQPWTQVHGTRKANKKKNSKFCLSPLIKSAKKSAS